MAEKIRLLIVDDEKEFLEALGNSPLAILRKMKKLDEEN